MLVDRVTSPAEWRAAISEIGRHDFVHTYDYHAASEANGDGEPFAFALRDADGHTSAFWPLLKRNIGENESFDFGNVYGYGGPIFRGEPASDLINRLIAEMAVTGAVAVYSRLHPLFHQSLELEGKMPVGEVVSIEVSPDDEPPRNYRNNHKRDIKRLTRDGFTTRIARDEDAYRQFARIYEAAMDELQATEQYYFQASFYESIGQATDFDPFIIFAEKDERPVAAVLFTATCDIMQYFLSATLPPFKQLAPSKLIIATAHRLAAQQGMRHLMLGGGVGGQRDSLFNFKLGFSDSVRDYYGFGRMLDRDRYSDLCSRAGVDPGSTNFFPAYRSRRA